MAQSESTKVSRAKLWLYRILDWLCLFLPVIVYVCIAFFDGGVTAAGKVAVAGGVIVALILTFFNVIAQKRLRCPIWILLIGLFIAMKEYLLPLVIILAVTTTMDDLLFTPLIQHYKMQLEANKAIDARLGDDIKAEEKQQ